MQRFFRTTTREVELGGATIPEGEKVLMLLGAANRDPRRRPDPTATTSTARPRGMSRLAPASTRVSGNCWRGSKARRCSRLSARACERIEPDREPTPLLNNTLRGWVWLPVRVAPA